MLVDREKPAAAPSVTSLLTLRRETHLAQLPLQPLMPFDATNRLRAAIPFAFDDYLELVETTGRSLHPGKRGLIHERVPALRREQKDTHFVLTFASPLSSLMS